MSKPITFDQVTPGNLFTITQRKDDETQLLLCVKDAISPQKMSVIAVRHKDTVVDREIVDFDIKDSSARGCYLVNFTDFMQNAIANNYEQTCDSVSPVDAKRWLREWYESGRTKSILTPELFFTIEYTVWRQRAHMSWIQRESLVQALNEVVSENKPPPEEYLLG